MRDLDAERELEILQVFRLRQMELLPGSHTLIMIGG